MEVPTTTFSHTQFSRPACQALRSRGRFAAPLGRGGAGLLVPTASRPSEFLSQPNEIERLKLVQIGIRSRNSYLEYVRTYIYEVLDGH